MPHELAHHVNHPHRPEGLAEDDRALTVILALEKTANRPEGRRLANQIKEHLANGNTPALIGAIRHAEAWLQLKKFNPDQARDANGRFSSSGTASTSTSAAATQGARNLLGHPLTQANIRAFQHDNGLKVDGTIGRQTAAALLGYTNAPRLKPGGMTTQQRHELEAHAQRDPLAGNRYPMRTPPVTAGRLQPQPGWVKPGQATRHPTQNV